MTRSKKKPPIVKRYKDTISYRCPIRGDVNEEREIIVYGTGEEWIDEKNTISLKDITPQ